jgi:hypothetical protein
VTTSKKDRQKDRHLIQLSATQEYSGRRNSLCS